MLFVRQSQFCEAASRSSANSINAPHKCEHQGSATSIESAHETAMSTDAALQHRRTQPFPQLDRLSKSLSHLLAKARILLTCNLMDAIR
jgi:hypothetical protein